MELLPAMSERKICEGKKWRWQTLSWPRPRSLTFSSFLFLFFFSFLSFSLLVRAKGMPHTWEILISNFGRTRIIFLSSTTSRGTRCELLHTGTSTLLDSPGWQGYVRTCTLVFYEYSGRIRRKRICKKVSIKCQNTLYIHKCEPPSDIPLYFLRHVRYGYREIERRCGTEVPPLY